MTRRDELAALYRRRSGLLWGLLAFAIVLLVLSAGEEIGLANNGDFGRVMAACGLRYEDGAPTRWTYVGRFVIDLPERTLGGNIRHILFSSDGLARYPSLHVLIVRLAAVLELLINAVTGQELAVFRLRVLGAVYAALYAAGLGCLCREVRLRRLWADILWKLCLILMACDIGYIAYFNSLYGEAPEHIALIWCAAAILPVLTRRPTVGDAVRCAVCAVVYGWAKFFDIPMAILFGVGASVLVLLRTRRAAALLPGLLAAALLLGVWRAVPSWMDKETSYNALFYGVLRDTEEEEARGYLAALGLPEELAAWRDTNYYLAGVVPSLEEQGLLEEATSVRKGALLRFYLTHPGRLAHQVRITAMHCGMLRPYYLANQGAGHPLLTMSGRMSLWSRVRDALSLDTVWGVAGLTAAFLALAAARLRRRAGTASACLALAVLAAALGCAFFLPAILNGEGDLAKHMFAFAELADLMLLGCAGLLLGGGPARQRCLRRSSAAVLAAGLLLPSLLTNALPVIRALGGHAAPERGAYVRLGTLEGRPLTWLVTAAEGDTLTLLCLDGVERPFDEGGSNDWRYSSSRAWLGEHVPLWLGDGADALVPAANDIILNDESRAAARSGDLDFACSHIAALSDRGWERAYRTRVEDTVMLPDIHMLAELTRDGVYFGTGSFWLETPYCPSGAMTRWRAADGHVYLGGAEAVRTLRPVITIEVSGAVSGRGSLLSPYVLSDRSDVTN